MKSPSVYPGMKKTLPEEVEKEEESAAEVELAAAEQKSPKTRSRKKAPTLPWMPAEEARPRVVWFSKNGCVVREGEKRTVVIATQQVGAWERGERGIRNALMVQLAKDPTIILEDLAKAFEVSSETLRLKRRLYEEKGLGAILTRAKAHSKGGRAIEPALRRQMEQMFRQGKSTTEVAGILAGQVKHSTVEKYRRLWKQKQEKASRRAQQMTMPLAREPREESALKGREASEAPDTECGRGKEVDPKEKGEAAAGAATQHNIEVLPPIRAPRNETSERIVREPLATPPPPEAIGANEEIAEYTPFSAKGVQHLGSWLLLVMACGLGLYKHLHNRERRIGEGRVLRVAVDAVLIALAMGGKCVESVRRLATSTVSALLLSDAAPCASWVRRTLGGYSAGNVSGQLLEDVAGELLREARQRTAEGEPVVLFFDNHARPYTGKHKLGRIWRMQGKRTVPGAMDYWVHDVQGRPIFVVPVTSNASLPNTLREQVGLLREKLGHQTKVLLAFDRAGAFPGLWKDLREMGVEFVTYQRKPHRKYGREWFERHGKPVKLHDVDGEEYEVMVQSGRMNLKRGRGRVRRIRLLMPDDAQINVVGFSKQSDEWLCQTLFSRWNQENAFRHGVERWGLNQLDGRQVKEVPQGTTVTDPEYTKLKRTQKKAREEEKELRLQLQQLYPGHPDRRRLKRALADNQATQHDLEERLSQRPKRVPIENTELNGKLVQHTREYKLLIDAFRCVAQNAEAELAAQLAPGMVLPGEAKRLLQNVFAAPGDIQVSKNAITVSLDPAVNRSEKTALTAFFSSFNDRRLCHPGDPHARPVRFQLRKAQTA